METAPHTVTAIHDTGRYEDMKLKKKKKMFEKLCSFKTHHDLEMLKVEQTRQKSNVHAVTKTSCVTQ